jgi:hypothetical protein
MIAIHGGAGLFKEGIEKYCSNALTERFQDFEINNELVKSIMVVYILFYFKSIFCRIWKNAQSSIAVLVQI